MPDYLKEADWKSELDKAKNLGLRAQGTGISEKLRVYQSALNAFNGSKTESNAGTWLKAIQDLRTVATDQSKKHKAFTDATSYMLEIVKACNTQEIAILQKAALASSLAQLKKHVDPALEKAKSASKKEHVTDTNTDSLYQKIRTVGAACSKIAALTKYGKLSGDLTSNETLVKVTDKNWADHKAKYVKFLEDVKKDAVTVI